MQNVSVHKPPLKIFAAKNMDEETRIKSSSGGVFSALANSVIDEGGVVFGVSFDKDWLPVHSYTERREDLCLFRGSKYVQSKVGTAYVEVKQFLKAGRKVLFSGTSCQVAGLNRFLGSQYDNLLTVEILCHGVPSPLVWQRYLEIKKKEYGDKEISAISFRDKRDGWSDYNVVIDFQDGQKYVVSHKKDPYFKGFIKNIYLRPSCYACKCKNGRSFSDIAIADFWCINAVLPGYNDKYGTSMVLVNSQKGHLAFETISAGLDCVETGYRPQMKTNSGFAERLKLPIKRILFYNRFRENSRDDVFNYSYGLQEMIKAIINGL